MTSPSLQVVSIYATFYSSWGTWLLRQLNRISGKGSGKGIPGLGFETKAFKWLKCFAIRKLLFWNVLTICRPGMLAVETKKQNKQKTRIITTNTTLRVFEGWHARRCGRSREVVLVWSPVSHPLPSAPPVWALPDSQMQQWSSVHPMHRHTDRPALCFGFPLYPRNGFQFVITYWMSAPLVLKCRQCKFVHTCISERERTKESFET